MKTCFLDTARSCNEACIAYSPEQALVPSSAPNSSMVLQGLPPMMELKTVPGCILVKTAKAMSEVIAEYAKYAKVSEVKETFPVSPKPPEAL